MVYGNKELVENEIKVLDELPDTNLLDELSKLNLNIAYNDELKRNCQSDFSYWEYEAKSEEYDEIKKYLEERIFKFLEKMNVLKIENLKRHDERLMTILEKKDDTVRGLKIYRPSHYKQKIELIESIFEED